MTDVEVNPVVQRVVGAAAAWIYEKPTSRGKMQLLTIGGISVTGTWYGEVGEHFMAWSPLLKRDKDKERIINMARRQMMIDRAHERSQARREAADLAFMGLEGAQGDVPVITTMVKRGETVPIVIDPKFPVPSVINENLREFKIVLHYTVHKMGHLTKSAPFKVYPDKWSSYEWDGSRYIKTLIKEFESSLDALEWASLQYPNAEHISVSNFYGVL
jgi:hypothetical protein